MPISVEEAFRILEVHQSASWEEVKQTYREMVKVWHPDRFHDDEKFKTRATRKIQDINAAFKVLEAHFETPTDQPPPLPQQGSKDTVKSPPQDHYVSGLTSDEMLQEVVGHQEYFVIPGQFKGAKRYRHYLDVLPIYLAWIGFICFLTGAIFNLPTLFLVMLISFLSCVVTSFYRFYARFTDPKKIRPDALVFTTEYLILIQWVLEDQATKLHKAKNITQIPWPYVQKVESSLDKLIVQVSDNSVSTSHRFRISPRQTALNHRDIGYYKKNVMTRRDALAYVSSRGHHVK